ncbi:MAG: CRISPR-associated endonuclease Cas2 [Chloroflexota bacterium]|nr:CRISPR-associated endonuclease Cas2 [Chloroflexota bacterium]
MSKKRTLYVVAYDISSDKRRGKIHKTLCGFGKWTQYSLFEVFLNDKELVQLQNRLEAILNSENDSLRFYPLCENCLQKVETVGSEPPQETQVYVV